jgi:hypothetical protein
LSGLVRNLAVPLSIQFSLIAMCVSLLSTIGLLRFFGDRHGTYGFPEDGRKGTNLDFILLPYTLLGVAIIFSLLIGIIIRMSRKQKAKRYYREFYRGTERRYP